MTGEDAKFILGIAFVCSLALSPFILGFSWLIYRERSEERKKNANYHQGQDALNRGDLDLALSCANEEIRRDEKRARGYRLRGQALHGKGMYREAIQDYCRAIRLTPADGELYRIRGDSYAALGFYTQAIAEYSDAIRLNPADTAAIEHRKAAYAERETRGDAPSVDLPGEDAIITELPSPRDQDAYRDNDPFPALIPRPAVSLVLPTKAFNPLALTGFILGLTSIVFYFIGIIPILGIVFSGIGLGCFNPETQKGKWMAGWGLALSILYTFTYLAGAAERR